MPFEWRLWAFRRHAMRAVKNAQVWGGEGKPSILFINHFFDTDVEALGASIGEGRMVVLDAAQMFRLAPPLFPEDVRRFERPYTDTPQRVRRRYAATVRAILRKLITEHNVQAVGSTSDIFYWYRAFTEVAPELGLLRFVVDKEGTISPWYFEHESRRIQALTPFASDVIYVWSKQQHAYWLKAGAPPAAIRVVGQPRSDLRVQGTGLEQPEGVHTPLVTWFAFETDAYVPRDEPGEQHLWLNLREGCMKAMQDLADLHPTTSFVVKLHPQEPDTAFYESHAQNHPNLKVLRDSRSANWLLMNSHAVVAFQSTVAIEAGSHGIKTYYPAWNEHLDRLRDHLLPVEDMPHVRSVHEPNELVEQIHLDLQQPAPIRLATKTNPYIEHADGQVCARIVADLDQLLCDT